MSSTWGPVEISIRNKLHINLEATHMEIINESHLYGEPYGAETHFKVIVVSRKFEDMSSLKRHRLINDTLREEIRAGVRALSIVAKTPAQWALTEPERRSPDSPDSPDRPGDARRPREVARWP